MPPSNYLTNYDNQVGSTTAVSNYPSGASPFGILDMAGNVSEWVNDWYADNYYQRFMFSNPTGSDTGEYRVLRGGSWMDTDKLLLRAQSRSKSYPASYGASIGFRCVAENK
jgi:formylglycine-generating enzyme required for sulfatase activity